MDIRQARITPPANTPGTTPPMAVTGEGSTATTVDINEQGIPVTEDFGGDLVAKSYMEYLNKHDISLEDVQSVQDALFTSGNVQWTFDLFGRIPICFEVRPAWVDSYILELVDNISNRSEHISELRFSNLVAECNLGASLTKMGDQTYSVKSKSDLEEARKRVQNMPFMTFEALIKKLAVFDRVIAAATSDWAIKNFTKPQQES